jgi:hypothetical protein
MAAACPIVGSRRSRHPIVVSGQSLRTGEADPLELHKGHGEDLSSLLIVARAQNKSGSPNS